MIEIILITHGKFSEEILRSAELIIGPYENTTTLTLERDDNIEVLNQRLVEIVESFDDSKKVLILTDLLGGSPFNIATSNIKKYDYQVLTGLNLPMLIEALIGSNDDDVEELAKKCYLSAIEGVKNIRDLIS